MWKFIFYAYATEVRYRTLRSYYYAKIKNQALFFTKQTTKLFFWLKSTNKKRENVSFFIFLDGMMDWEEPSSRTAYFTTGENKRLLGYVVKPWGASYGGS